MAAARDLVAPRVTRPIRPLAEKVARSGRQPARGTERGEIARHFIALSTYLGHADITYWYLQATPEMMSDIAAAAEMLAGSEAA